MTDLAERLAVLSPERRRVLEQLLRANAAGATPAAPRAEDAAPLLETMSHPTQDYVQRFYDSVNRQLDSAGYGEFARFLNYGYVSDGGGDRAVVELPEYTLNKPSVKLVLELIGDCPIDGSDVLDVGCGRGGLLETVATYFQPRRGVGMDLTPRAVIAAEMNVARASTRAALRFLNGDAQRLPFADASFDVVTNLESSHTYPDVEDFYRGVHRVLRPGGRFLYSDALAAEDIAWRLAFLRKLGFALELERDITANVVLACDAYATARTGAFRGEPDGGTLDNFLAAPGSNVYEQLKDRTCIYQIFRFRKRERRRRHG